MRLQPGVVCVCVEVLRQGNIEAGVITNVCPVGFLIIFT